MDNKKNKIMTMVFIVSILILVVSTTYAFFAPQNGGTTSSNATVTSNTTDLLTFSINRDISFTVTQALFAQNGQNQSGDATATATLTPNNKTGVATMNYYLYLNLQSNPTVYSSTNTNEDPELMLQVFDGNNQLVTLTGLGTQKTIKGVTGYDITGVSGLKTLLDNHAISATNNTATIENWRVVITLINLDVNQNDNTGKTISAEIIISGEEVDLGFTGTIYRNNTVVTTVGSSIIPVTGTQWVITDGTQDLFNYDTENECTTALTGYGSPQGFSCEEKSGTFGGAGTYETNVNTIRTNYDYYLKHEVENNLIESTEVCLWYNNHEFCMGPNYWTGTIGVEDATEGANTKTKLKVDMESALGITIADSSCISSASTAFCGAGDFRCFAYSSGNVRCYSDVTSGRCNVDGLGSADCR